MNAGVKLSAYGVALVVVFAGAWAVGNAAGPLNAGTPSETGNHQGRHSIDHAQPGDTTAAPITPAPPPGPPLQQHQPVDTGPAAVAQPPDGRQVGRTAAGAVEAAAVPVAIVPSSGRYAEPVRRMAPAVERTPGTRRNHDRDGVTGRDRGCGHQHDHHQARGRGQR
ncbi:MAG: hypothetical protein ACRDTE_07890 [Pseudonocardiaceae bacterium]